VQRRVARLHRLDARDIFRLNRLFELTEFRQRINVRFQFGPTCKAIQPGDFELRVGERRRLARFEQIFGLRFQMSEIGLFGQ
jgi:hypothetical protein